MKRTSRRWRVGRLDTERVLIKLDELATYLRELRQITPRSYEEYLGVEKKRACERLLQLAIESVIDVCHLLVSGLRLGLPAEEDDLFGKLTDAGIVSESMGDTLREMKGFRNILVHEYARVDDRLVYEAVQTRIGDFRSFAEEVRAFLRSNMERKS
jgi:uncharacterized protein YutE (UPF0331/DUF86 family)